MEQKNLKFLLTSCVWVTLNRCIRFGFFSYMMNIIKQKKIGRRRDQALPVVIPGSLVCVHVQTNSRMIACGMQHMHVYEECSWTCWIGSVLLFFHLKDWCGGGIFGTGCPLWELTLVLPNLHWMPLNADVFVLHDWRTWHWKFSLPHDSEMNFCTFWHWAEFPPFPLSFIDKLSFCFSLAHFLFTLHSSFFLAAVFSKL